MKSKFVLATLFLSLSILIKTNGQNLQVFPLNLKAIKPFSLLKTPQKYFSEKSKQMGDSVAPKTLLSINQLPNATLVGNNNNFHIYQMPIDNMICFIPNGRYIDKMPTNKDLLDKLIATPIDNMPNAFKKQNWLKQKSDSK